MTKDLLMRSIFVLFCFFFSTHELLAQIVDSFSVQGNERIESQTIESYVGYVKGKQYTEQDLNISLKKLLGTGLFSDATLRVKGKTLLVNVQENPLVRHISIEGNLGVEGSLLEKEIQLKSRRVFKVSTLKADVQKIKDIYRVKGYFSAEVKPQVIRRDQNRVDVIFKITEGSSARVRKIIFIGNKGFSDSTLETVMQTKESRWYRFFSSDDTYDPDRLALDQEKLRQHYLEHGYVDFYIKSAVSEFGEDHESFYITLSIDEGKRYKVNKISVQGDTEELIGKTNLHSKINFRAGEWYSSKNVESSINDMISLLGDHGYAFTDVSPVVEKNDEKQGFVDVSFNLVKGRRAYIRHIIIRGNNRTNEEVIRRELRLHEGDAFHISRIKDSERRVKNLGFFRKVTISQSPTPHEDQVDLVVDLDEEQRTGELFLAGGFLSGQGLITEIGMREDNLFGKGQVLNTKLRIGGKAQDFDVAFTEPYFLDRRLAATFSIFSMHEKNVDRSDYTEDNKGGRLSFGYELAENLYQVVGYALSFENLKGVDNESSRFLKEQRGKQTVSAINHKLTYDRLDSRIDPKNGYQLTMGNKLTGLGGTVRHHLHTVGGIFYTSLFNEDVILSVSADTGIIQGLGNKKVRITDRFSLGGHSLRGFDFNGIGPRDKKTEDALRGTRMAHGTIETTFPVGLPKEMGIRAACFLDMGSIWHSGEKGPEVDENNGLRMGAGFGLMWKSPMGPLRFDFARAIRKKKGDEKRAFLFGYSTKF